MPNLVINDHFFDVVTKWDFDILCCIGSYGSGKSHEMSNKIAMIASTERRRIAVVRKNYNTHKDSTYEDLFEAFERIGTEHMFDFKKSPLTITDKRNKQNPGKYTEIKFKGADDKKKLKSLKGFDIILIEEANELGLEVIKELVGRLRGQKTRNHLIMMTNPGLNDDSIGELVFSERGWNFNFDELYSKRELEGVKSVEYINAQGKKEESNLKIKLHHSLYTDNKFNSPMFIWQLEQEKDPDIIRIAREGRYGITQGLMFKNIEKQANTLEYIKREAKIRSDFELYNGLDFGHSISYDCLVKCAIDKKNNYLYIYDGLYEKDMTTDQLSAELVTKTMQGEKIICDSEDPRLIKDLRAKGHVTVGARKGQGSVMYGLSILRGFDKIIIDAKLDDSRKRNIYKDFKNLARMKKADGTYYADKFNIDPHATDATRYALEPYKPVQANYRKDKPKGW